MTEHLRHVGLNLAFLTPEKIGGMETYARELVPALRSAAPELNFTAFVNRHAAGRLREAPWLAGVTVSVLPVGSSRVGWVVGDQLAVPTLATRAGVDVLHSLASTGPGFSSMPRVVTVHDLIYRYHPDAHQPLLRMGMSVLVPFAAHRADRVIAISHSTARGLSDVGVPATHIDVVYNGGGSSPAGQALPRGQIHEQLGLNDAAPLILCPSAKRPHKNLERLLHAFAQLETEPLPSLVIPGYPTSHERKLRTLARQLDMTDRVRFPGWLPDMVLEGLYRAAQGVVLPSLSEGFGLPVLEAMARSVPVACSDRSALAEVAGDAALLFDPEDVHAIAAAVTKLLLDGEVRNRLAGRGRRRASLFGWDRCARGTIASYRRALEG